MGAKIEGAGTSQIVITGVSQSELRGCEYTTLPDRIEAGTYMSIIIASKGTGIIKPQHLPKQNQAFFVRKHRFPYNK